MYSESVKEALLKNFDVPRKKKFEERFNRYKRLIEDADHWGWSPLWTAEEIALEEGWKSNDRNVDH